MDLPKKIVFVNFQFPFANHSHALCFTNMLYRLIDFNKNNQIEFHLLSFNILPENLETYKTGYEYFINNYLPKVAKNIFRYRKTKKDRGINSFIEMLKAARQLRKYIKDEKIDTVYLYSDSALYLILFSLFKKVSFIFDCRGDFISEQRALGYSDFRLFIHKIVLRITIPHVKKIFISSSKLKDIFVKWTTDEVFTLNTNYYDDNYFKLVSQNAHPNTTRFIYSGGVAIYQLLGETIKLFKCYHEHFPDSELILLVLKNHDYVRTLLEKYKIDSSTYILRSASTPQEINECLNGADFGVMLRDNDPLNYYAFPTKFGEYLAAGIPVIATKGVYDTYKLIIDNSLGIIIDLNNDFNHEAEKIHDYLNKIGQDRKKFAEFAFHNLSWSANIERIYNEILTA